MTKSLLTLALLLFAAASATTYTELTLEEMAQKAELAVYGTVEEVEVEERDGEPWTVVSFEVERALKGDADETLELSFYGGTLPNGRTLLVDGMPQFTVGERVLLLAYDAPYYSPLVGFSQGLWRLTEAGLRDEAGRTLSLDEAGGLEQDGSGAGTEDLLTAFETLLEGAP